MFHIDNDCINITFFLSAKAVTLIFIFGCSSAISSSKKGMLNKENQVIFIIGEE